MKRPEEAASKMPEQQSSIKKIEGGYAMDDDSKLSYFFLGLGLGVAAGVLFAPKSGAETRDYLRSRADDGSEFLKRRSTELRETATEAVERGKATVQKHKENLTAAVEAGTQAYREAENTPTD